MSNQALMYSFEYSSELSNDKRLFRSVRKSPLAVTNLGRSFQHVRDSTADLRKKDTGQLQFEEIVYRKGDYIVVGIRSRSAFVAGGDNDHRVSAILDAAKRLDERGRIETALDLIYDRTDEWMRESRYSLLDTVFEKAELDELSIDILLGILTATLPVSSKLKSRHVFFKSVEQVLKARGEYEDGLLDGLEGRRV